MEATMNTKHSRFVTPASRRPLKHLRNLILLCSFIVIVFPLLGFPGENSEKAKTTPAASARDGQHDFDFEIGSWKIHLKKLEKPLTGSTKWIEFDGTSVTRKVWNGRANLEEFNTDGAGGHIQ